MLWGQVHISVVLMACVVCTVYQCECFLLVEMKPSPECLSRRELSSPNNVSDSGLNASSLCECKMLALLEWRWVFFQCSSLKQQCCGEV